MAKPATGQIIVRDYGGPQDVYALRFQAYGRRRYLTLGRRCDGWGDQRARDELDRVMSEVRDGLWDHESALMRVVQDVIGGASHDDLNDLDLLTERIIDRARPEDIQAELHSLVKRVVIHKMNDTLAAARRRERSRDLDLDALVTPAGDRKRLSECTVADIDTLGYEAERRANDFLARAGQWRSLASTMRSAHARTVADLGVERASMAWRRGRGYKVTRNDEVAA